MGPMTPKPGGPIAVAKDRLDSWKAIASYLGRDVRTAQRWERDWGMPVHRLPGGPKAGVFGYRREIDEWLKSKPVENGAATPSEEEAKPRKRRIVLRVVLPTLVVLIGSGAWWALSIAQNPKNLLSAQMRFTPFATSLPLQTCPAW